LALCPKTFAWSNTQTVENYTAQSRAELLPKNMIDIEHLSDPELQKLADKYQMVREECDNRRNVQTRTPNPERLSKLSSEPNAFFFATRIDLWNCQKQVGASQQVHDSCKACWERTGWTSWRRAEVPPAIASPLWHGSCRAVADKITTHGKVPEASPRAQPYRSGWFPLQLTICPLPCKP
jgi:hypothetical protein